MRAFDHPSFQHGHDPATRLLASLADAVSRLRRPPRGAGAVACFCVVGGVLLALLCTALLWLPLVLTGLGTYALLSGLAALARTIASQVCVWRHRFDEFVNAPLLYPDSPRDPEGIRKTLRDPRLVRQMLDALPGVETESAMKRINSLTNLCAIASPQARGGGGAAGPDEDAGWREQSQKDHLMDLIRQGFIISLKGRPAAAVGPFESVPPRELDKAGHQD